VIIDTHAHISDIKFDTDRKDVIQRALDSGIVKIFEIACQTKYWDKALELIELSNIFAAFGIHPNDTSKASTKDYKRLELLIQNKKCVAVGEIGLDYHYKYSLQNINIQKESFIKQLKIACKYNKPVIIHCRDAYDIMLNFLKKYKCIPKGVIHCFSGTLEQAQAFTKMGFLLGIDGPLTYKNSSDLKQVVSKTSINELLVETDCPYLTPQKYRGQRNEPSYIIETLKEIALIKGISFDEAANITVLNTLKLFNIKLL
jgi:TatD DNase family protein